MSAFYEVYCEDCIKKLSEIQEETFDMIFADPPYFLSCGGITCDNTKSFIEKLDGYVVLSYRRKKIDEYA